MKPLTQIWSGREDFDKAVADAMALLKLEPELAPVIDIRTKEVIR